MAKLPLADAVIIRDETIPNANTAARIGSLFEKIVNFVNLSQIPDEIITPVALNADVNNYGPVGFTTCNIMRVTVTGGNRRITGFVAPPAGVHRIIRLVNITIGGDRVDLKNNDAGSLAANRILFANNSNQDLREGGSVQLWYDHTSQRWRSLSVRTG